MTIEKTKGICGGRPRISGTRITVAGILYALKIGMTPEKIVKNLARDRIAVTLEDIQSAIEYATDVVNQNETKQCTECGKNLYESYPVMCAPCMSRWCEKKTKEEEPEDKIARMICGVKELFPFVDMVTDKKDNVMAITMAVEERYIDEVDKIDIYD